MYIEVSSDWLPGYIKATRPVLEILKLAGYFPDSPHITDTNTESVPRLLSCFLPFLCILETRFTCPVYLYKFITTITFWRQIQSLL